jgi:hypothetical protein
MPGRRSFSFLSPLPKLVAFFKWSRDNWKEKCKEAKRRIRSLKVCLAKMKESRDRWKARAKALEATLAREGVSFPEEPEASSDAGEGGCPVGTCPR